MKLKHVSAKNLTKSMELIKVKRFKYALGNIHFFAIFGDTYLPMYYVRFFLTYLPTQKLDILYERSLIKMFNIAFRFYSHFPARNGSKSRIIP